jgi:hypothetical protein
LILCYSVYKWNFSEAVIWFCVTMCTNWIPGGRHLIFLWCFALDSTTISSGQISIVWMCVVLDNMKPARPWMLAHLKIIWQFHTHPVHQKVSTFFGQRYIGDDFFLGPNLVSFNRAVVPLFELSFLTKSQKLTSAYKQKFLSVCQKRFNKLKNINISKTS